MTAVTSYEYLLSCHYNSSVGHAWPIIKLFPIVKVQKKLQQNNYVQGMTDKNFAERQTRIDNTHASYSGDPSFKSLSSQRIFEDLSVIQGKKWEVISNSVAALATFYWWGTATRRY